MREIQSNNFFSPILFIYRKIACPPNTQNRTVLLYSVNYKRKAGYLASACSPFEAYHSP